MQTKTLGELAKYVGGQVCGDSGIKIKSASTLSRAGKGEISFLANRKYEKQLSMTKASAVIMGKEMPDLEARRTSKIAMWVALSGLIVSVVTICLILFTVLWEPTVRLNIDQLRAILTH